MAAFSYVAFLRCARAQLYLLSREVTSLRCCSAINRIKCADFYHQSFCRSMSTIYTDSKTNKKKSSGKDINGKDMLVNDDQHVQTAEIKETLERHDFQSKVPTDGWKDKDSSLKQVSVRSQKKKTKNISRYLEQSWLNYYSSAVENAQDTDTPNQVQEISQSKKEKASMNDRNVNSFGNLSIELGNRTERPDWRHHNERMNEKLPDDVDEPRDPRLDMPLSRYGRQNKKSFYYTRKISIAGREGKIKEALSIFEHWMMVRDRVMPSKRTFVALIGILGRVGYTEKAFELFSKMKQLGLDPVDHIYTSLFNACANSPSVTDGLKRTEYLLNHMKEKGVLPNKFTVKAAMKALAISGDFSRAFALLDEAATQIRLDRECFGHLFMACISDKEAGFRRALQVWQKMGECRIRPNTITFNLLIRSVRDCDVGDLATFCSAFHLDPLEFKIGENPGLLENIDQSLYTKVSKENTLPLPRPVHLTDNRENADAVLEVVGTKMNIQSSLSSWQPDSSACLEIVPIHVSEYSDQDKINSNEYLIDGQETTCSRNTSHRNTISSTTGDQPDNLSDTCTSMIFPQTENCPQNVGEWWEETSNSGTSKLNSYLAISGQTQSGINSKSLYSEILTVDSSSDVSESMVSHLSLKDLKFPFGRLALLGGAGKFISYMETVRAQPDIKTFTQLLACLPNNEQSEFDLLKMMEERGMKPDIDFLNDIMMRRNSRKANDTVKAVLKIVAKLRLTPNMRTYAAMALTCLKEKEAHGLLTDMQEANLEPNSVIMGHLIYISQSNFTYKLKMLKTMESLGVKVTRENIGTIEKSIALAKKHIIEAENKKDATSYYLSEHFQRSFQYFLRYYRDWLKRAELDKPRHPWDAFKHSSTSRQEKSDQLSTSG